jgi:hypothetical protein
LTTDDHREAFFHISEWSEDDDPCKGERVSFVEDAGHGRGPCAREVRRSIVRFKLRPLSDRF